MPARKSAASKPEKNKSLEQWIWDAACSIRGANDAPKYKDFILPLIFTKRDHKFVRFFLPLEPADPEQPVWSVSASSPKRSARASPRTCGPSPRKTRPCRASSTASISMPAPTASLRVNSRYFGTLLQIYQKLRVARDLPLPQLMSGKI